MRKTGGRVVCGFDVSAGRGEKRVFHTTARRILQINHKAVTEGNVCAGGGPEDRPSVSGNQTSGDRAADAQRMPFADDPATGDLACRNGQGRLLRAVEKISGLAVGG